MSISKIQHILAEARGEEIKEGMGWYREANRYCWSLSRKYGVPMPSVVGALAALSPRNKWERNKADVESLLLSPDAAVGTFGANKKRALQCLSTPSPRALLTGRKVRSFYDNILHYNAITVVTVDVWMGRIWDLEPTKGYDVVEEQVKHYAASMGILPHQLQAILWVVYRRLYASDYNIHPVLRTRDLLTHQTGDEAVVSI